MVKLISLLKEKKKLMILTFANLITQLGITYYVMNNTNVTMMLYSFHRKKILSEINTFFVNHQILYIL